MWLEARLKGYKLPQNCLWMYLRPSVQHYPAVANQFHGHGLWPSHFPNAPCNWREEGGLNEDYSSRWISESFSSTHHYSTEENWPQELCWKDNDCFVRVCRLKYQCFMWYPSSFALEGFLPLPLLWQRGRVDATCGLDRNRTVGGGGMTCIQQPVQGRSLVVWLSQAEEFGNL